MNRLTECQAPLSCTFLILQSENLDNRRTTTIGAHTTRPARETDTSYKNNARGPHIKRKRVLHTTRCAQVMRSPVPLVASMLPALWMPSSLRLRRSASGS